MRPIDADRLDSALPAADIGSNHVTTRNFAVESFRALIKSQPTVNPGICYVDNVILNPAVRHDLQAAFPKGYITLGLEMVVYPTRNVFVPLSGASSMTELKARIIECCSGEARKSYVSACQRYHLAGINRFLNTEFSQAGMEFIYTYLGNGIRHKLCLQFVGEMDCNLNKLKHEIQRMEGMA